MEKGGLLNKSTAEVTDIAILKARKLIRKHVCPFCNNTMIDYTETDGLGFWACRHCDFGIYDQHLYDKHLDFLAAIIRKKISERKERIKRG
jgi:ribosomal protein L37AE/L43A